MHTCQSGPVQERRNNHSDADQVNKIYYIWLVFTILLFFFHVHKTNYILFVFTELVYLTYCVLKTITSYFNKLNGYIKCYQKQNMNELVVLFSHKNCTLFLINNISCLYHTKHDFFHLQVVLLQPWLQISHFSNLSLKYVQRRCFPAYHQYLSARRD